MVLYSLVQITYLWFKKFKEKHLFYNLMQSQDNDALFYNLVQNIYITVYIDNIEVFYPEYSAINDLKVFLTKHYKLHDLRKVK